MGNKISYSSIFTDSPVEWEVSPVEVTQRTDTFVITGTREMMTGLKDSIERLESVRLIFNLDHGLTISVPNAKDREVTFKGKIPFEMLIRFEGRKIFMYLNAFKEWSRLECRFGAVWETAGEFQILKLAVK